MYVINRKEVQRVVSRIQNVNRTASIIRINATVNILLRPVFVHDERFAKVKGTRSDDDRKDDEHQIGNLTPHAQSGTMTTVPEQVPAANCEKRSGL